jgi:hypothetical protein
MYSFLNRKSQCVEKLSEASKPVPKSMTSGKTEKAMAWTILGSNPGTVRDLFSPKHPDLGPTHPPIQWVPEDLSPGAKAAGR